MKCSLGVSNFFEQISSLSHSIVFLYFFALIAEEGFLISPCYSLELCIQIFPFLLCFLLLFFSQQFVRPCQTSILLFCISFSWGWSWFLSLVQCQSSYRGTNIDSDTGASGGSAGKESACQCRRCKRHGLDPLEEEMTTPFSILARRIPLTEEPMGLQGVRHDWMCMHAPTIDIYK